LDKKFSLGETAQKANRRTILTSKQDRITSITATKNEDLRLFLNLDKTFLNFVLKANEDNFD